MNLKCYIPRSTRTQYGWHCAIVSGQTECLTCPAEILLPTTNNHINFKYLYQNESYFKLNYWCWSTILKKSLASIHRSFWGLTITFHWSLTAVEYQSTVVSEVNRQQLCSTSCLTTDLSSLRHLLSPPPAPLLPLLSVFEYLQHVSRCLFTLGIFIISFKLVNSMTCFSLSETKSKRYGVKFTDLTFLTSKWGFLPIAQTRLYNCFLKTMPVNSFFDLFSSFLFCSILFES